MHLISPLLVSFSRCLFLVVNFDLSRKLNAKIHIHICHADLFLTMNFDLSCRWKMHTPILLAWEILIHFDLIDMSLPSSLARASPPPPPMSRRCVWEDEKMLKVLCKDYGRSSIIDGVKQGDVSNFLETYPKSKMLECFLLSKLIWAWIWFFLMIIVREKQKKGKKKEGNLETGMVIFGDFSRHKLLNILFCDDF